MRMLLLFLCAFSASAKDHAVVFPGGCQELRDSWLEENGPVTLRPATYDSLIATEGIWGQTGALVFKPADNGYSCQVSAYGGPAWRVLRYHAHGHR